MKRPAWIPVRQGDIVLFRDDQYQRGQPIVALVTWVHAMPRDMVDLVCFPQYGGALPMHNVPRGHNNGEWNFRTA